MSKQKVGNFSSAALRVRLPGFFRLENLRAPQSWDQQLLKRVQERAQQSWAQHLVPSVQMRAQQSWAQAPAFGTKGAGESASVVGSTIGAECSDEAQQSWAQAPAFGTKGAGESAAIVGSTIGAECSDEIFCLTLILSTKLVDSGTLCSLRAHQGRFVNMRVPV